MTVLVSSTTFTPRITSYAGLLTELTRLIDGEDTSVSDIATNTLAQIVNMGERRIYREVRSRHNERDFDVTVTDNEAGLPEDFEACSIVHFGGYPLRPMSEEALLDYLQSSPSGECAYFAEAGDALTFAPAVSDDTEVQGRYFCRLADLSSTTLPSNELFRFAPDLFIYAALAESGPYFGAEHMSRIPFWEAKYVAIRDRINTNKNRAAFSAGRMTRSNSTRLIR